MNWLNTVDNALYWLSKPPPVDPPEKNNNDTPIQEEDLLSLSSSDDEDEDLGYISALSESLSEMSLSQDIENWLTETGIYDLVSESFDRAIPMEPEGGRGRRLMQREETIPFRDPQKYTRQGKSSVLLDMKQNSGVYPEHSIFVEEDQSRRIKCWPEEFSRRTKDSLPLSDNWERRKTSAGSLSQKSGQPFSPKSSEGVDVSGNSSSSPLVHRQDSGVLENDDWESSSSQSSDMATHNTSKDLEKTISDLDKAFQKVYRGKYSSRKRKRKTTTPPGEVPPPKVLSHSFSNEDSEEDGKEIEIPESITPRNRKVTFSPSVEERYMKMNGTRFSPSSSRSNTPIQPEPSYCLIPCRANPGEGKVHIGATTRWLNLRRLLCALKNPGITPEEEARIRQQVAMAISEKASNKHRSGPKGPEQIEVIHVEESFGESNDFFRYGDPDGILFVAPVDSTDTNGVPWWCRKEWKSTGDSGRNDMENKEICDHLVKHDGSKKRLTSRTFSKDSKHLTGSAICRDETRNLSSLPVSSKGYSEQPDVNSCRPNAPNPYLDMKNKTEQVQNERSNAPVRHNCLAESTVLRTSSIDSLQSTSLGRMEIIDLCDCTEASKKQIGTRKTVAGAVYPDVARGEQCHPNGQALNGNNLLSTPRRKKNPGAAKPEDVHAFGALQYAFDSVVKSVSNEIDSATREFTALAEKWDSMVLHGVSSLVGEKPDEISQVTRSRKEDNCLRTDNTATEEGRRGTLQQTHYQKKNAILSIPRSGRIYKPPRPEFLLSSPPSPVRQQRPWSSGKRAIPSRPSQLISLSNQPQSRPPFHRNKAAMSKESPHTPDECSLQSKRESLLRRRARIQARLDSRRLCQQENKPRVYPEVKHATNTKACMAARRDESRLRGFGHRGRPPRFSTEDVISKSPLVRERIRENLFVGCPSPSGIPTYQHMKTSHIEDHPEGREQMTKRLSSGRVDDKVILVHSCSTSSSEVGKHPVPSNGLNHTASELLHNGGYGNPDVFPAVSSPYKGCASTSFVEISGTTKLGSLRESVKHAKDNLATKMSALIVSKERSQQDTESAIYTRSAKLADGSGVLLFKPTINVYGDASSGIDAVNSFTKGIRNGTLRNKDEKRPSGVSGEVTNDHGPKSPGTSKSFFESHEVFSKDLGKRFEETDSVLSELLTLPRSPQEKTMNDIFDEEDGLEHELEQLAWSEKLLRDELESIQEKEAAIRWKADAWNFHPSRVTQTSTMDVHGGIIDLSNVDDYNKHKETGTEEQNSPGQEDLMGNQDRHALASILIPSLDHDQGSSSASEIGVELVYVEDSFLSTDSFSFATMKGISSDSFMPLVECHDRSDHPRQTKKVNDSQDSSHMSSSYRESCSASSKSRAIESAQTSNKTNPTFELPPEDSDEPRSNPHQSKVVQMSHEESDSDEPRSDPHRGKVVHVSHKESDDHDEKRSDPHQGKIVHASHGDFTELPSTPCLTRIGEDLPWGKVELLYQEKKCLKTSKMPDGAASKFQKQGAEKDQRTDFHSRAEKKVQNGRFTTSSGSRGSPADVSPWESSSEDKMDSLFSLPPNVYVSVEPITVPCDVKKVPKPKSGKNKSSSNRQSGKFIYDQIVSLETGLASAQDLTGAKCHISLKKEESYSTIEQESKAKSDGAISIESVTSRSCLESIASEEAEQRLHKVYAAKKNQQNSVTKSPSTSIEEESIKGYERSPLHPYWSILKPNGFDKAKATSRKSSIDTNDCGSGDSITSSSFMDSIPSTEADQNLRDVFSSEVSMNSATESRCPSGEEDYSAVSSRFNRTPAADSARDSPCELRSQEDGDLTNRGRVAKFTRIDSNERGNSSARYFRLIQWHNKHRRMRAKLQSESKPADQAMVQPRRSRRRVTHGIYAKENSNSPPQSPQAKAPKTRKNSTYTPRLLRLASKSGWKSLKSSLPATARARHLASAVPGSLLWEAATDGDSDCMYA